MLLLFLILTRNECVLKLFIKITVQWTAGHFNKSVPFTETTASLKGLSPATSYHVRIFAINDLGDSEPSKVVPFTTSEEGKKVVFNILPLPLKCCVFKDMWSVTFKSCRI